MTELMDKVITLYNYCFYGLFFVEALVGAIYIVRKGITWALRTVDSDYYEAYKAKKAFLITLFTFIGLIGFSVIVYFAILKVFLRG